MSHPADEWCYFCASDEILSGALDGECQRSGLVVHWQSGPDQCPSMKEGA